MRAVLILAAVLLLIIGLVATFAPPLRLVQVEVEGATVVDSQAVGTLVQQILNQRRFFIWPQDHQLWYPRTEIKAKLEQTFPRILAVELAVAPERTLRVSLTERSPRLLLCTPQAANCFFVDETGLAYTQAPRFSPGVFLEWRASTTATSAPFVAADRAVVTRLLTAQTLFTRALDQISDRTWQLPQVSSLPNKDFAFTVWPRYRSATTSENWQILIDGVTPAADLATNFFLALKTISHESATSSVFAPQYIDLRFGEKVFYKL